MNDTGIRLLRGYRLLLASCVRTAGVIALLGVAALLISIPLWFLATKTPVLFNYLFFAALGTGCIYVLTRKKARRISLDGVAFGLTVFVTVAFLVLGYVLPAIVAAIILSAFSAWRVSKR